MKAEPDAVISPLGFREYDARWQYPEDINLAGLTALGLGLGTQMFAHNVPPSIIVGADYRSYSDEVKQALIEGLVQAGVHVRDIGMALSPMAYFAQFHLDVPAVAMVTASHNPNGWTGVKMGFSRPLTHGPSEMSELKDIVLTGQGVDRDGGRSETVGGVGEAYLDDLIKGAAITRPLRVVCATGNGTAGAFAPALLERMGVEVIPRHTELDYRFPNYNPNPEALEMLHDMAECVRENDADFAVGFDGDGDRCGVVDENGHEIFADKLGVIFARDLAPLHPNAHFIADVKSTGLFANDPVLTASHVTSEYWKTGHSHMKRRVKETNALAGFEKSGHFFFAPPIGRGYDCGLRVAVELCKLMDRNPTMSLSELHGALPVTYATPTLSPYCPDDLKYDVLSRIVGQLKQMQSQGTPLAGQKIDQLITVNGARVVLASGAWGLVRASSNTPNLVVVCESPNSDCEMRDVFVALDAIIQGEPEVGPYDQSL